MLSLKAILGLDGSGYERGIKRAESLAESFAKKIEHFGKHKLAEFLGAAAAEEGIRRTIEYASEIADLSARLGVSTDALQKWDYALQLNGASAGEAASFFEKLAMARDKALSGDESALATFKQFGVTLSSLQNKRIEDTALDIGKAYREGDAQKLIGALRTLGGKGAGAMAAAFKEGLPELFAAASTISEEDIFKLKELQDRIKILGIDLRAAFAGPLATFGDKLLGVLDAAREKVLWLYSFMAAKIGGGVDKWGNWKTSNADAAAHASGMTEEFRKQKEQREDAEKESRKQGQGGGSESEESKARRHLIILKERAANAKEAIKLQEKLNDLIDKNNLSELSKQEQINALMEKRNRLLGENSSLENQIKAEELRGEINKLMKDRNKDETHLQLNSLQQIGGRVSFMPRSATDYLRESISANTKATMDNTAKLGGTDTMRESGAERPFDGVEY